VSKVRGQALSTRSVDAARDRIRRYEIGGAGADVGDS
jgi:hypothetical protein